MGADSLAGLRLVALIQSAAGLPIVLLVAGVGLALVAGVGLLVPRARSSRSAATAATPDAAPAR